MMMLTFLCTSVFAQKREPKNNRSKEDRIELQEKKIVKELMLDSKTAALFTPLYKEYMTALKECRLSRTKQNGKQLSDEEFDKQMKAHFNTQRKVLDVKEKYYEKFKKILNIHQLEAVFKQNHKSDTKKFSEKKDFKKIRKNRMRSPMA